MLNVLQESNLLIKLNQHNGSMFILNIIHSMNTMSYLTYVKDYIKDWVVNDLSCLTQYRLMIQSKTVKHKTSFDDNLILNYNNRIVDPCYIPQGEYKEQSSGFFGEDVKFQVMETEYGHFIRPIKPHLKYQYEDFFGFGCGNMGFDLRRTVYLPFYNDFMERHGPN